MVLARQTPSMSMRKLLNHNNPESTKGDLNLAQFGRANRVAVI